MEKQSFVEFETYIYVSIDECLKVTNDYAIARFLSDKT